MRKMRFIRSNWYNNSDDDDMNINAIYVDQ